MLKKIILDGFDTNTYIIYRGGHCILVDPGFNLGSYLHEIINYYNVCAILITHGHIDHIDGIRYFDVPVYFPKKEEPFLTDPTLSLYSMVNVKMPFSKDDLNIIWVEDGMEFELLGYHFKAIETPGHTKGSMCYYCELGLFSGDTLFRLSVGRTDFPTGNEIELSKSLKRLCDSLPKNTKVYPGHQEETTLALEMKRNHWLKK